MTYDEFLKRTATFLAMTVATIMLCITIWNLADLLMLVFFCWVLSIGFRSMENFLERRGWQRTQAILASLTGLVVVILLIGLIVIPPFISQTAALLEDLPNAIEDIVGTYEEFYDDNEQLQPVLPQFDVEEYRELMRFTEPDIEAAEGGMLDEIPARRATLDVNEVFDTTLPIIEGIGSFLADLLANLLIILFITGYLIADPFSYYRALIAVVPQKEEARVVALINRIQRDINAYLGTRLISISFMTVTIYIALGLILQIPNAFALGVIAGLGSLIPNLGYYIGFIPIVIFTAVTAPVKVIPAVIIYWLLNEIEGKLVTPSLMKEQLKIPASVILPFQIIAASVFGLLGIVVAVPLLTVLIHAVREIYVSGVLKKHDDPLPLEESPYGDIQIVETQPANPKLAQE